MLVSVPLSRPYQPLKSNSESYCLKVVSQNLHHSLTDRAPLTSTQVSPLPPPGRPRPYRSALHFLPVLTLIALCGDQTISCFFPALTSKFALTLDGQ